MSNSFSSREFTRDVAMAKRATAAGPVFITDRGQPRYALLSIEEYHRLAGIPGRSLLQRMDSLPNTGAVQFDPPRAKIELKPAVFD